MTDDTRFGGRCGRCGEVELTADQLWLVVASDPAYSHYAFVCPGCGAHVRTHARPATVAALEPRVPVEELTVPAEARELHAGLPLTVDDLIDLMVGLADPGRAAAELHRSTA